MSEMSQAKFIIPNKLEDLRSVTGDGNRYIVSQEFSSRETNNYLNDLGQKFKQQGWEFILDDFDYIYSAIKNFKNLDSQRQTSCWKYLVQALSTFEDELSQQFQRTNSSLTSDQSEKFRRCNSLKMLVFSVCTLIEVNESGQKWNQEGPVTDARKSAKKKPTSDTGIANYDREREKAVSVIFKLLVLPIQILFQPPVVEEELIKCTTRCCWKLIENQALHRNKPLMDYVFHIIGFGVEKHSGSLGFCLKVIQLLQHRENLVTILASMVSFIVKNHNQSLLISELIREIERIDIKELSRDSSGPKAISMFLCEVAEKCPKEMMSSIANLLCFLEQDSYMMRNATLSIIGTIVLNNLSQDKMSSREKHLRDELLNKLELHLMDVSSYTRGRALQVWSKLCSERKIPLTRLDSLMEAVVSRLQDKTTYVRKSAVQFLTCFLQTDIFAVQLDLKGLTEAKDRAKKRLDELTALQEQLENQGEKVAEFDPTEAWNAVESDLLEFLLQNDIESLVGYDDKELESLTDEDFDSLAEILKGELDDRNFSRVAQLYTLMKEKWPKKEIFREEDKAKKVLTGNAKQKSKQKQKDNKKKSSENENDEEDDGQAEDSEDDEEVSETEDEASPEDKENDFNEDEDSSSSEKSPTQKLVSFCKKLFIEQAKNQSNEFSEETLRGEIGKVVSASQKDSNQTQSTTISTETSLDNVVEMIEKQKNLLRYLKDIIKVTNYLKSSVPLVCTLLNSKNIQDVQEAIKFLVTAYEFGIKEEAQVGLRKLIVLIFAADATKKEVIEAYKRILIESADNINKTGLERAKSIVKKLVDLVRGASLDEIISIQELLKEFMTFNDIDKHVIQLLWDKFALKSPGTTEEESQICIQLLSMLAASNCQLIRKNLDTLVTVGLGDRALTDLKLARHTCSALSKAMTNQGRIVTTELPYRLARNHTIFENLSRILVETFPKTELEGWLPMCEEAFKVIYNLAEHPDLISEDILYGMIKCLMELDQSRSINSSTASDEGKSTEETGDLPPSQPSSQSTQASSNLNKPIVDPITVNPKIIARFVHCIGTVAMNLLVHLEVNVFTELKTRNAIKEERDNRKSLSQTTISMRRKSGRRSMAAGNEEEDELGLSGVVTAEDAEAEFISSLCNNEIVDKSDKNGNLLAILGKLVVRIASDPKKYSDQSLKAASSLTLAKLMAISENFCQNNLRLLFTILNKTDEPIIRSNTIIAIGDLCVRFPNLLEPWTSYLYQTLRDDCVLVRTNALKVISRLILSDMIKVQDQISEIAKLMVDAEENVSSFAKLFFTQLSKKLNAVYNVLPDIISNLSDTKVGIEENDFKTIMRFLFELIDKERHTIGLLEKLCQRFKNTLDERQWCDLAFCLSLLKYSDKSISKLFENFACFADKVSVLVVYELFMAIIAATRKTTGLKNETKQLLDEFESKLKNAKNKGVDEGEIEKDNEDGKDGEEEIDTEEAMNSTEET